ncbi:helix-turn-helix domain-containing protein [Plesiomonas shigelloides]|uniref:helix-turn-helix domain-containing protein n=1 Tax=Plesiomonas shigelloides TaxID=703 RepID=UPI00111C829C|nr:helix-turn-helix transcriptional regulator [Plesiomonas shigelloides]
MVKPVEHKEVRAKALASPEARAAYQEALREYDDYMEIINLLDSLREHAGIDREEVAVRMGLPLAAILQLEQAPERARLEMLRRYAIACEARLRLSVV